MEPTSNSLTLYPNKLKTLFYVVICFAFTYFCITQLQNDTSTLNWIGIIFFSIGCIVLIIKLFPGSSYLRLSEKGFVIRSLFKESFTSWNDVQNFKVGRIGYRFKSKIVVLEFNTKTTDGTLAREIANNMSGYEGALPDTYKKSAEELASLLNEWREKYTTT